MIERPMTAFVLSGGAALGATQVGMLRALLERDIHPDLLIGTSIGAWNALWIATHPNDRDVAELETLWKHASLLHLFGRNALSALPRLIANRNYLLSNRGIRRLLQHIFPGRDLDALTFEDLPIPLKVNATNIMQGVSTTFERGLLIPAILASSAIPGVFPPILIDGQQYVDGGILDNGGVSVAIAAGARRIYVMSVAYGGALTEPIPTVLGLVDRCFHLIASRHVRQVIQEYHEQVEFIVIEDERIQEGSLIGFWQTATLIEAGYQAALRALAVQ